VSLGVPAKLPERSRLRFLVAAALLLALLGAFFSTPLARFSTHSYSACDLLQDYSLTRVQIGHPPGNRLLSDPVTEMVPWLLYNRAEFRAGRVPLWDDRNAAGAPHLGNFQSAVFSPFSLPFYVFDLKTALLLSAFLKLGALALFTFLFLDLLGLGTLACVVGAAAFTFSGHNVLLLAYPHAAAVVALPAGLYFAQLALLRGEQGRSVLGACLGLALTFALGLFCGQPEPFYFCVVFVALWCVARMCAIAWREWLDRGSTWGSLALGARILVAALLGACLAAPQLLPFLEYLERSTILGERSAAQAPLAGITWPLYAFPDLMGNPTRPYHLGYLLPPPNYEAANTCYLGAFAMIAAASALLFIFRVRAARYFVPAAAGWFLFAYDIGGAAGFAAAIPGMGLGPINRSQSLGLFSMSVCAAIVVHALSDASLRGRWKFALAILLAGAAAFGGTAAQAWELFGKLRRSGYAKALPAGTDAYIPAHMQYIAATCAAGLLALLLLSCLRRARWQRPCQLAILAVVFLQSGWLMRDYNPTVEDRFVYPVTPTIEKLQRFAATEPLVILGGDTLPPHVNSVYGIQSLSSYDAMWVREYDMLYRAAFGPGGNWRLALQTSTDAIRRFGARLLLSPGTWVRVDSLADDVLISPGDVYLVGPILPGEPVVQTIVGQRERLQGIALQFSSLASPARCTVEARLEDVISGQLVASSRWRSDEWTNDHNGRREVLFHFEAMPDARHRPLRLTISSPDATPENCVSLWARNDYWYWNKHTLLQQPLQHVIWSTRFSLQRPGRRPHGELRRGDEPKSGGLLMDQSYDLDRWTPLKPMSGYTFALLKDPLPRYTTVSRGIATRRATDDFKLVSMGKLDPAKVVVISLPEGPAIDSARTHPDTPEPPVEVLLDRSEHARLRVVRESPGYLVLRRAFYPGWEAILNGERVPVQRADFAFCAVELPAGESTLDFVYRPKSFRNGLWIAGLSPLIAALLYAATRKRGRIVRSAC